MPAFLITEKSECPSCKAQVSILFHDYSLCSQLKNAEYRIRQLEQKLEALTQEVGTRGDL